MKPISNDPFSHDAIKFVYQNPDVQIINCGQPPSKPFKLSSPKKSKKTKKDLKKKDEKDPNSDIQTG